MNKTININLGGYFFHIDESAYQKLKRYLDAIARSLSDDPQGKNEIIADIEARISELLSERITDARQVVNEAQIEEIIGIMGQPEDYAEAEEGYANENTNSSYSHRRPNKKLFRDIDDRFLAGVCSGLGHYLGIDTIWIRLITLVLMFGFGFGFLIYILLWILLPEAKTTSEKLQMQGEPVNINNIEKKIRDDIETLSVKLKSGANDISDKISSADYDKLRSQTKSGLQDFLDTLGKILIVLFKVFGKFMGALLLFIAGVGLISLIFALFTAGSVEILNIENNMMHYPPFFYGSMIPKWLLITLLFLVIGIPFLLLFILGLRIISPNVKRLNTATSLTLSGIWLVSSLIIGFSALEYFSSNKNYGTKAVKQTLIFNTQNPIKIGFKNNDDIHYEHNLKSRDNAIEVTVNDEKMKYSNDVELTIKKSENGTSYVEILKKSKGNRRTDAVENADKIKYEFNTQGNILTFDAYFLSEYRNIWRNEEVEIILYLTEGTTVFFENSSKYFLNDIDNTDDVSDRDMAKHTFKMTQKGFECLDCEDLKKNDTDWNTDEDNNKDVSFLFDSTINDAKAELIINSKTTKEELEKLVNWFKRKKNIDIDFSESSFYENGTIQKYILKVNCNDGFSGSTEEKGITINNGEHGFVRNYDKDGKLAFKIW